MHNVLIFMRAEDQRVHALPGKHTLPDILATLSLSKKKKKIAAKIVALQHAVC